MIQVTSSPPTIHVRRYLKNSFFFEKRLRRVKSEYMPILLVWNLFLCSSVCWENDVKFILILFLLLHLNFQD